MHKREYDQLWDAKYENIKKFKPGPHPHTGIIFVLAHLYESTGRAIVVTLTSASASHSLQSFTTKFFKHAYLSNHWPVVWYIIIY